MVALRTGSDRSKSESIPKPRDRGEPYTDFVFIVGGSPLSLSISNVPGSICLKIENPIYGNLWESKFWESLGLIDSSMIERHP